MYEYTIADDMSLLDWIKPISLEIDPEKARLKALGLPYQHIGKVDGTEESATKEKTPYIVQVLTYLYNMRVPFDTRMGLKKIYYSIERDPISKEITQAIKEFFETHNLHPHASGEYPIPANMEQYQYLEQTYISEDCYSFKPKDVSLPDNCIEADLHRKAVEVYRETHL